MRLPAILIVTLAALLAPCTAGAQAPAEIDSSYAQQRAALVRVIEQQVLDTRSYTGIGQLQAVTMNAMRAVPRPEFVPAQWRDFSYQDRPLPIGQGQTISQPYIVALMTDLAGIGPDSVVLEIGTGSGYQAAVLAEIAAQVYTIEILEPLGREAAQTLARLGYRNVQLRVGDGYAGWPEFAPFDAIIVTAAPAAVPRPLVEQLKIGGRLVVPVGEQGTAQSLRVLEKRADGTLGTRDVLPVLFVPLTR